MPTQGCYTLKCHPVRATQHQAVEAKVRRFEVEMIKTSTCCLPQCLATPVTLCPCKVSRVTDPIRPAQPQFAKTQVANMLS